MPQPGLTHRSLLPAPPPRSVGDLWSCLAWPITIPCSWESSPVPLESAPRSGSHILLGAATQLTWPTPCTNSHRGLLWLNPVRQTPQFQLSAALLGGRYCSLAQFWLPDLALRFPSLNHSVSAPLPTCRCGGLVHGMPQKSFHIYQTLTLVAPSPTHPQTPLSPNSLQFPSMCQGHTLPAALTITHL